MIELDHLPNQQRGEETRLFLRRHWIAIVSIAFYGFILLAIPVLFWLFLAFIGFDVTVNPGVRAVAISLASMYFFCVLAILMTQYTDYYLDTWIVTTERIINIEHKGLFSRVISTLHLNQVQDITAETHGIFAMFLTYGDVFVQTAGTRERFNFKTIDNPEPVKQQVMELVEEDKRRHGDASRPV